MQTKTILFLMSFLFVPSSVILTIFYIHLHDSNFFYSTFVIMHISGGEMHHIFITTNVVSLNPAQARLLNITLCDKVC